MTEATWTAQARDARSPSSKRTIEIAPEIINDSHVTEVEQDASDVKQRAVAAGVQLPTSIVQPGRFAERNTPFNVYIPNELAQLINEAVSRLHTSKAEFARVALKAYLEQLKNIGAL